MPALRSKAFAAFAPAPLAPAANIRDNRISHHTSFGATDSSSSEQIPFQREHRLGLRGVLMAILKSHVLFYREIFAIKGILEEPFLMLGHQEFLGQDFPEDFRYKDVKCFLMAQNIKDIKTLDLFDDRADLKYDLNYPVPEFEHGKYSTVFDIGTLEHLFDTRTCLENCLRMVKLNGMYYLHTCVNGYFAHGLHVFNPSGLINALRLNHFQIIYLKYSNGEGMPIDVLTGNENVLIWIVARKIKEMGNFIIPQQEGWETAYKSPTPSGPPPTFA
jgi:hypothetical protein